MRRKAKISNETAEVQKWFAKSVTYDGEAYVIDAEQAAAVADQSFNTIVVARAGSGKTRTLVAKMVYLIARCGVEPEEMMAFVFNRNAAVEINERLAKMRVEGEPVVEKAEVATTFHAFARKIVYKVCKGEERCGKILAGEKEAYVLSIVQKMMLEEKWKAKIEEFIGEGLKYEEELEGEQGKVASGDGAYKTEMEKFAGKMTQFINRAQQKYLGGEETVGKVAKAYLKRAETTARERLFIELGVECFRRYHWYLLDAKKGLKGFSEYGTDFNLIVSWASKLIASGRKEVVDLLGEKKYILIDEYQDFSQLFLAAVEAIRGVASEARLFVVGDDWQAINRFAGSEVEYFKEFELYFGKKCGRYEITTNYRCDKAVVETARRFMRKAMKEKGNFKAFSRRVGKVTVVDPGETELGYALVPYDKRVSAEDKLLREAARKMGRVTVKREMVGYLKTVVQIVKANRKAEEVMILHRNNVMSFGVSLVGFGKALRWGLERLGVMSGDEFDEKVKLMTMHKSKGLEAEVVVILEADEGVIPKTHPDTLLYQVFGETEEVALNDQKRLFYVAMTRAKRRLYVVSNGGGFAKWVEK